MHFIAQAAMIPSGRTADAEQQVDAGALAGGHDRAGDVAVDDELDPGAGRADLRGQILVPRPVEQHDGDVLGGAALGLGDLVDVLGDRVADVDHVGGLGAR